MHFELGRVFSQLGDEDQARAHLEQYTACRDEAGARDRARQVQFLGAAQDDGR